MAGDEKGFVNIMEDEVVEQSPASVPDEIDVMDERQFREALLQKLDSIDWKLWEIHQVVQQFKD